MLRRSPFKRPARPLRMRDREPQPLPTVRSLHRGVMAFAASDLGVTFAVPAWEQYDPHNPALVDQDTGEIRKLEHV